MRCGVAVVAVHVVAWEVGMTPEAQYLRSLLTDEYGPGWTVEAEAEPGAETPCRLTATRGNERVSLSLKFNGGSPFYLVVEAPEPVSTFLRDHRMRPAVRRVS